VIADIIVLVAAMAITNAWLGLVWLGFGGR